MTLAFVPDHNHERAALSASVASNAGTIRALISSIFLVQATGAGSQVAPSIVQAIAVLMIDVFFRICHAEDRSMHQLGCSFPVDAHVTACVKTPRAFCDTPSKRSQAPIVAPVNACPLALR